MDPYLEAHWRDIHARLVIYASDAIQGLLPASLRARASNRGLCDGESETFVEIITIGSNRVVTVVEMLSPSSKTAGLNRKQHEICASQANLVEIDLNRSGPPALQQTAYMVCVRRATQPGKAEIYPMPLWDALPTIRIPLRADDADVGLNLQAVIDQCYRNGGYEGTLDYSDPPDPPLTGADIAWADERLRHLGLRSATKPTSKRRRSKKP